MRFLRSLALTGVISLAVGGMGGMVRAAAPAPATQPAAVLGLCDFSDARGDALWTSSREVQLSFAAPPTATPGSAPGQAGRALHVVVNQPGGFYTKAAILPKDLATYAYLTFQAYRDSALDRNGAAPVLEVQLVDAAGKGRYWRKVELSQPGWNRVVVPLRLMRWSDPRSPRWEQMRFVGFFGRNAAEVWIDDIALERDSQYSAEFSVEELAQIAFPDTSAEKIRTVATAEMRILTDCPQVELPKLQARLEELVRAVRKDMPFLGKASSPPVLLVFAQAEAYRTFTPRLAKLLDAQSAPPKSGGYTVQGIATAGWEPSYGTMRPVYLHEFVHALMDRVASLPCGSGDWLQEGLANYYQLRFYPQANFGRIVQTSLADSKNHLPLRELLSGQRVPLNRYWQAATVLRMFLEDPKYQAKWPALFAEIQNRASTNLDPLLKPVLDTDWDGLTTDWRSFCARTYFPAPVPATQP